MTLLLQAILSIIAGVGVFRLWRRVAASSRAVFWLVTAGFLIRAVAGIFVFWVSWLHLPLARSLQFGNGLWIFADDARNYFHDAGTAALGGPGAILFLPRTVASVFFVQVLAVAFLLFGTVNSTGILVNVAAYLAICAVVLHFGDPRRNRAVLVAVAAISFSPSVILWSLQPLKDVVFLLLLAIIFAASHRWQRVFEDENPATRQSAMRAAVWTAVIAMVLYGISGIRFYFGIIILLAAIPFVVLTILRARSRLSAAAGAVLLLPLLAIAFYAGAGPYVPLPLQRIVARRGDRPSEAVPTAMWTSMNQVRNNFDDAGGATIIGAGRAIQQIDRTFGKEERQMLALRPNERSASARTVPRQSSATNASKPKPAPAPREVEHREGAPGPASPAPVPVKPAPIAMTSSSGAPRVPVQLSPQGDTNAGPPSSGAGTAKPPAPAPGPREKVSPSVATESAAIQPAISKLSGAAPVKHDDPEPSGRWSNGADAPLPHERVRPAVSRPAANVPAPPAAARVVPVPPVDNRLVIPVSIPASPVARVAAGSAALILPRFIAERLGILDVRGGRGLWLFVEVDTIFFDAVLVFTTILVIGAIRRRTIGAPLFWLCFCATAMLAGALTYTVSNFGTLFRHRDMIFFGLLLVSVAASAVDDSRTPSSTRVTAPEPMRA